MESRQQLVGSRRLYVERQVRQGEARQIHIVTKRMQGEKEGPLFAYWVEKIYKTQKHGSQGSQREVLIRRRKRTRRTTITNREKERRSRRTHERGGRGGQEDVK